MLEWIKARRSIRRYTDEIVNEEHIQALLEAAMAAPTASNKQPWEFVVVRDAARRKALSQVHQWSYMAAEAPVVFVICGREDVSKHWVEDCAAATENLLLAATALGLGGVWVGIYPTAEREAQVQRLLHLPECVRPLCLVPLGHPAETQPPRTQYDASKVHNETF